MAEGATRDPGSRRKPIIWLAVGAVVLVAFIGVALYWTGEPEFCGSCHEMGPAVEGWEAGTHEEVSCFACHSDPGAIGYLEAHVVDGLRDVWIHFTERPERVMEARRVPVSRCQACHDQPSGETPPFPADDPNHPPLDSHCGECHRGTTHGDAP